MNLSKNRYLQGFGCVVAVLALVRCVFPSVAEPVSIESSNTHDSVLYTSDDAMSTVVGGTSVEEGPLHIPEGNVVRHRIYSVPSFRGTFPDNNDIQLEAAVRNGVDPVANRTEAERRMDELVYVGSNPYYHIDPLRSSIPYLVPKGIPLHKIIVTSVLRTKDDVANLRKRNGNATENSCHLYGTTIDICYNRYKTVEDPDGPKRRQVRNDTLKWVLSEVLRDFRQQGRCYVKYEVKQGCFHLTVN